MRGLEIAKAYFEAFGKDMLEEQFGDCADRIAAGLVGEGSECFGYDDEVSKDHDFEPAFCLWITEEDERKFGFRLERAYAKLPKEFMGLRRQRVSPVGGGRHGVLMIEDFYRRFLGTPGAPECAEQWLYLPESALAAACNGEVFQDPLGKFSEVREILLKGFPEDVRKKKLAARTVLMAQAGQYNYARCVARGETGAAQLAIFEFVKNALSAVYLLNNRYEPFYKWAYRGMRELPLLAGLESSLVRLTETGNSPAEAGEKQERIEEIAGQVIAELKAQGLSRATCNNLETHAYSVMDSIRDSEIRNMHIMEGV